MDAESFLWQNKSQVANVTHSNPACMFITMEIMKAIHRCKSPFSLNILWTRFEMAISLLAKISHKK